MKETGEDPEERVNEIDRGSVAPPVMAAIGSVALALYYYYVRGQKQRGQFVGLWPPTILGLAAYVKLDEIRALLEDRHE